MLESHRERLPCLVAFIGLALRHRMIGQRLLRQRQAASSERNMSAGSARECRSIADVAHSDSIMSAEDRAVIKDRCDHICAMLNKFR